MRKNRIIEIILQEIHKSNTEHNDKLTALAMATSSIRNQIELLFELGESNLEELAYGIDHDDPVVRMAVIFALGTLDDRAVVPFILRKMNDPDPLVRHRAATQFRKWTKEKAHSVEIVPALLKALHDPDKTVRSAAAYALEVQQDLDAIEPLIEALNDSTPEVKTNAAYALQRITGHRFILGKKSALKWHSWWNEHKAEIKKAAPL